MLLDVPFRLGGVPTKPLPHLCTPAWWREVILLTLGLDNPSLFEPVLQAILRQEVLLKDVRLANDCLRNASSATPHPLLAALASGLKSAEGRYHTLRFLRFLPGWESEALPDGTKATAIVEHFLPDLDPQVAGMAAELFGIHPAPAERPIRRREPAPGEERRHEVDGTVLLYVPGGEYILGADDITDDKKPVHRVILSPFWIAKYPVTNEQYGRFLAVQPGAQPQYWGDTRFNQPNQPVVGVCWEEAQAYCAWASLQLPNEAQWESAARGIDRRRFPWGNEEPTAEHANFDERENGTTPVGAFPKGAGPFGTLDQAGNIWEWCLDLWNPAAYRERDGESNPVSTTGGAAVRCLRGGSWSGSAWSLATAYRLWDGASYRDRFTGFRCALPARPEP